jgi:hypothetical protein
MNYLFPFGQPLRIVTQRDRTPKTTFILGVYSGAVHACWTDAKGNVLVKALAVASEPEPYWTGDTADVTSTDILRDIHIPEGAGKLGPTAEGYNGSAGRVLDTRILAPLSLTRADVWLCDCVPHSCINNVQRKALRREYFGRIAQFSLPNPNIPGVPEVLSEQRRADIIAEFTESGAERMIVLGDQPINWFLRPVTGDWEWLDLQDFVDDQGYGAVVRRTIAGRDIDILPLAHPRQIAQPGAASEKWFQLHEEWMHP